MDIIRFIDVATFGLITLLLTLIITEIGDATSIFEVILGIQPSVCSSLTNASKQSIVDLSIIYPPEISEQLSYEYTISTPNFPSNYPIDIQCISLIKAPSIDYIITLEVRQLFDIEPSKHCARDFIEINDGPYGFSRKIGRFCNLEKPPKEIKSSGPFLWLRFRSDNNLPHNGFKIVYRFIRNTYIEPKIHYCYSQVIIPPGNSFNLHTSFLLTELKDYAKFQDNSSIPLECVFDFHVSHGFNTFVYKAYFKRPTNPLPCSSNRLDIFSKGTFEYDTLNSMKRNYLQICDGSDFKQKLFKYSTRTTFRILIQDLSKMNKMSFIITSVKMVKDNCSGDYHLCSESDRLCISKSLLCNNEINCPGKTDENCINGHLLQPGQKRVTITTRDPVNNQKTSTKPEDDKTYRTHAIILGSIGSVLVISMVFCLLLTVHSKKKDRESRHISAINIRTPEDEKHQNKNLFYGPNTPALSTEKLNRIIYFDDHLLSKGHLNDNLSSSVHRINDCGYKLNGDIKSDPAMKTTTINISKPKRNNSKDSSLNRIGKYLSVPYPVKSDTNTKTIIPTNLPNHIRSFDISVPSDDFQLWNSHGHSQQKSSAINSFQHIQRASSMGSGLRKQIPDSVYKNELSKNVEWYCGPVIKGIDNPNKSSEMLDASSAKSSHHVPGCSSLPNFSNVGYQNPIYYTKPIPSNAHNNETDTVIRFARLQC